MRKIEVNEPTRALGAFPDWVETGEGVVITCRGVAIARELPSMQAFDRAKARQAAERLWAEAKGATLGGISTKELVDAGCQ